jgi:hypothetical protein
MAALVALRGPSAPVATGKRISPPAIVSEKVSVRRRPLQEDVATAATVTDETWEEWATSVSNYITAVTERYSEGVPIANVTNRGVYKECPFVAYPGVKGGVEDALIESGFEIIVNDKTGGKLVKNRAA